MYYTHYNKSTCPAGSTPYIVQAGDTFYRLAARFNTTVQEIMAVNPGVNPNMLMVGQQICIPTTTPPPTTCPAGSTPYIVRAGDTFFTIARAHNVSLDALIAANPNVNPDRLSIGQTICIPGATPPPPTERCPTLRYGSRGPDVRRLQSLLKDAGFDPGAIDGIFGNKTQNAVIAFQKSKNLTPDGIVGVRTWTALGVNCGTPSPPSTCPSGSTAYTIKSGDTLYNLARRYGTTVDAIMKMNPGIDPNNLKVGQVICIPKGN